MTLLISRVSFLSRALLIFVYRRRKFRSTSFFALCLRLRNFSESLGLMRNCSFGISSIWSSTCKGNVILGDSPPELSFLFYECTDGNLRIGIDACDWSEKLNWLDPYSSSVSEMYVFWFRRAVRERERERPPSEALPIFKLDSCLSSWSSF